MKKRQNEKFQKAYELYLSGLSLAQVGSQMKCTRQSVYKAFRLRGYPLRGPNFQPVIIYDGQKFTLRPSGYYALSTNERKLMHRYVWEKERGKIPAGWDIHHKDSDKTNNMIENLECLSKSEHTRLYSPHNNQYTKGRNKCNT